MICHSCGDTIRIEGFIARTDECNSCGADVHCCLNCSNYEPSAHNRCREPQTEWISDREKANFCDFFIPNRLTESLNKKGKRDDVRKAFDDLFKK